MQFFVKNEGGKREVGWTGPTIDGFDPVAHIKNVATLLDMSGALQDWDVIRLAQKANDLLPERVPRGFDNEKSAKKGNETEASA